MRENTEIYNQHATEKELKLNKSFQIDVVDSIYKIHTGELIHEITTEFCKYFHATNIEDGSEYFALVFDKHFVPQLDVFGTLKVNMFNHLNKLVAYSIVKLSHTKATHLVAIVEKYDIHNNLGSYIEKNGPLSYEQISKKLVPQLTELLSQCEQRNINCGNINPFNILITEDDNFVLREFISSYSSFNQMHAYVAPEIAECTETGRQIIGSSADIYALAICVFYCLTGKQPWLDYESVYKYNDERFNQTTFKILTGKRKITENFKAFFKGALQDNPSLRWKVRNIFEWIIGNSPKISFFENSNENNNLLSFKGGNYGNLKSIAYALFNNWEDALTFTGDDKLLKWIKRQNVSNDTMESLQNLFGNERSLVKTPFLLKSNDRNNKLTKLLILIDPTGSIRIAGFALSAMSLPAALHYLLSKNKRAQAELIIKILQEKYWKFSKARPSACEVIDEKLLEDPISIYSVNSPVFGIERIVYSLNSYATCLSPTVINDYVSDIPDLLTCLDKNASEFPEKFSFDRHLIGFIAAKLNIVNDQEVKVLANFPKFSDHPLMYGLSVLNLAQKAAPEIKIQNLCNVLTSKIIELFEEYLHNVNFKKRIIASLQEVSKEGDLSKIVNILSDQKPFLEDYNGYYKACKEVQYLRKQIENLNLGDRVFENALILGQKLTVLMSYVLCLIVTVILII